MAFAKHQLVRCAACGLTDHAPLENPGACVACGGARRPVNQPKDLDEPFTPPEHEL